MSLQYLGLCGTLLVQIEQRKGHWVLVEEVIVVWTREVVQDEDMCLTPVKVRNTGI
jgi:hypothetical protein